jgi:hypothetical protein
VFTILVGKSEGESPLDRKIVKGKGKGKVVSLLNLVPRHEGVVGEWRYSSIL